MFHRGCFPPQPYPAVHQHYKSYCSATYPNMNDDYQKEFKLYRDDFLIFQRGHLDKINMDASTNMLTEHWLSATSLDPSQGPGNCVPSQILTPYSSNDISDS